jgi:eukaryotic-like serine/threonine-protein kinase
MKVGHYEITRKLGEGSMGEVFAAKDDRLGRSVALKLVHSKLADSSARQRLWREARAAAAVNHPNICQIYDIGEHDGELYVAMELLEGEPLSDRIAKRPLSVAQSLEIAIAVLDALSAIHRAGVVHRDLKPSNVFVTPHGVKLLDFGLARGAKSDSEKTTLQLTTPGTIVGTPRYMAPEQWVASDVGPAADLFSCGAMLFEMLTGKPAFNGDTLPALCHAVVHDHPPALVGGAEIQAIDRVITRALAKHPEDRYPDAASMAGDLRGVPQQQAGTLATQPRIRTVTRLMVLPFRLLRPDAEIDFLPTALADAVTSSLCGLESLVVRSSRAAAGTQETDVRKLAEMAEVDLVLIGNLLRAGNQLRLTAQLIEAGDGRVVWSKTVQSATSDIFELQDELTARLLESLSVKLTQQHDTPANARAYELYLRAMHVGVHPGSTSKLMTARDLYREAVRDDPRFAPAWARLARVYRVIAKYGHADFEEHRRLAKEAFQKALELNPDLPLTHNYYTYFELEEMGDAPGAIKRLLERVRLRPSDPELYAGLVTACRFAGLHQASAAADQRARRLDPQIHTSVAYTLWFLRDYERLAETVDHSYDFMQWLGKYRIGRGAEAIAHMRTLEATTEGRERVMMAAARAALEGDREACLVFSLDYRPSNDPEDSYFWAWQLAMVGERDMALAGLKRSVERNFCCHAALETEPEFDFLRADPEFQRLIADSRNRHEHALHVFREAGGEELLGR